MSIPQENRSKVKQFVMAIYFMVDRIIPYLVKFTLPFWAIPFITIMAFFKLFKLVKLVGLFLVYLVNGKQNSRMVYALVKGNGRYLKKNCEEVFVHQFYDYTSRKFMNIREIEPQSNIVEIECDNEAGVRFLAKNVRSGEVKGLNYSKIITPNLSKQSLIHTTDYSIEGGSQNVDIFLLYNFKTKMTTGKGNFDLVRLFNYCHHNINNSGYLVYGDYFQPGETQTFKLLFKSLNFKLIQEEDITSNILYAKKLMRKEQGQCEVKVFGHLRKVVSKVLGKKSYQQGKRYHVFILEKNQSQHS